MISWREARKAAVALVATLAIALSNGLVAGTAAKWSAWVIALASAVGVYSVRNAPAP